MKVEVKNDELVITMPIAKNPPPSASGKTLLVATTGGFKTTDAVVKDQPVSISVNATIKPGGTRKKTKKKTEEETD